jgi:hypothetical protein
VKKTSWKNAHIDNTINSDSHATFHSNINNNSGGAKLTPECHATSITHSYYEIVIIVAYSKSCPRTQTLLGICVGIFVGSPKNTIYKGGMNNCRVKEVRKIVN